jgi:acyl-CoA synthetase (AMP-forming)/AMP-acid ligase II
MFELNVDIGQLHPRGEHMEERNAKDPTFATVVPDFVRAMADAYGNREAVVLDDKSLTFVDLDRRSAMLARGLLSRGVGKSTRVGILLSNGPDWVVWWAAISRIGAVVVPLSTFARAGELGSVIRHADLHCLIMQPDHLSRTYISDLESALSDLGDSSPELRLVDAPFLRWVAVVTGNFAVWARSTDWILADAVTDEILTAAESEVHVDDPAITIYTSGTSDTPKGVMHTQGAIMSKVHYLRDMLNFQETEVLANMPFFWVGGLVMSLFTGMEAGHRVICRDASTYTLAAPLGASAVVENPLADAKLSPAVGMTETFGMYSWGNEYRAEGYPMASPLDEFEPGYSVKLVDTEGMPVADGDVGEIIVRGPTVTRQLVKVEGSKVFTADGYFRTGDRGRQDGERIHFIGRLGDMIKTSGANVAPPEVERELTGLDGVALAFVTGVDHPRRGQEVVAAVVAEPDAVLDTDALRVELSNRLSSYKVPRRIIIVDDAEIPKTPAQKVDRRALAALIQSRSSES